MKPIQRDIAEQLKRASRSFGALVLTGPRRAGKTYCLRKVFPKHAYYLLEDPDELQRVKADPRAWLEGVRQPAILDEIQNAPELFSYVRTAIDRAPSKKGWWILTGSQDFSLMQGVSESMAGRAAVFHLYPLAFGELKKWDLMKGGFPEVWARPKNAHVWFRSYIQTYLERDVRAALAVRDLSTFRRFMGLAALHNGQMLNKTALAAPLGLTVPTVTAWLSVLETTGLIALVPPYFENFKKRLVKAPKLYFLDTGLLCTLLNITSLSTLEDSPLIGAVFESLIASEIIKAQTNQGRSRELYYFRDHQGLEVDFVVPASRGHLGLIEVKWSKTPTPAMAAPIRALLAHAQRPTRSVVVHRKSRTKLHAQSLGGGVDAVSVEEFLGQLTSGEF